MKQIDLCLYGILLFFVRQTKRFHFSQDDYHKRNIVDAMDHTRVE